MHEVIELSTAATLEVFLLTIVVVVVVVVFYSPNIAINKSMLHIVKSVIWHEQGSTGCSNCWHI